MVLGEETKLTDIREWSRADAEQKQWLRGKNEEILQPHSYVTL